LAQRLKPKNSQNLPEKTPFSCIPRQKIYRTYTLKENEEIFHVVLGLVYVV
jgi:hypothetical protein